MEIIDNHISLPGGKFFGFDLLDSRDRTTMKMVMRRMVVTMVRATSVVSRFWGERTTDCS